MASEPNHILSSKHFTYKFYTRPSFGPDHTPYYTSWSDQILHQFDAQEKQRFYADRKAIHDLWDRLGAVTKPQNHASEHGEAMKLWVQNMKMVKRKDDGSGALLEGIEIFTADEGRLRSERGYSRIGNGKSVVMVGQLVIQEFPENDIVLALEFTRP